MMTVKKRVCWAAQWHSKNKLDGEREYLITVDGLPALFLTKKECIEFIKKEFGYIANRQDLRCEPYGWRMPKPVRVNIEAQR